MPTINLSWTPAGGGATGQKVYRSNNAGVSYSLLTTLSATANSYSDTTPTAGDVYFYKVATVCASGDEETLPIDICADASITTPIALEGITYVNPAGYPSEFTKHFSHFTFSIGELTGPAQHYQINKLSSTEVDDRRNYTGGPSGSVTSYNYCTGGWCFGQAFTDIISADGSGVTSAYSAYNLDSFETKVEIYFDGVLLNTVQSNINESGAAGGAGKTYDSSNPTGVGTQFLFLEPKGGSGFSLVVSLLPTPSE